MRLDAAIKLSRKRAKDAGKDGWCIYDKRTTLRLYGSNREFACPMLQDGSEWTPTTFELLSDGYVAVVPKKKKLWLYYKKGEAFFNTKNRSIVMVTKDIPVKDGKSIDTNIVEVPALKTDIDGQSFVVSFRRTSDYCTISKDTYKELRCIYKAFWKK